MNKETQEIMEQMPAPQTMNYEQKLKLSDNFITDMYAALDSFAYVEVNEIFNTVEALKANMPINVMNEIIRRIASFPYKNVKNLMHVMETNQGIYFELINENSTQKEE